MKSTGTLFSTIGNKILFIISVAAFILGIGIWYRHGVYNGNWLLIFLLMIILPTNIVMSIWGRDTKPKQ